MKKIKKRDFYLFVAIASLIYLFATWTMHYAYAQEQTPPKEPSPQEQLQQPPQVPNDDGVNLFISSFSAYCGSNADVGRMIKHENLVPVFATRTADKAYIVFTNVTTHHWAFLLFPIKRPDIACIAGAGDGYTTDDRRADGQKVEAN